MLPANQKIFTDFAHFAKSLHVSVNRGLRTNFVMGLAEESGPPGEASECLRDSDIAYICQKHRIASHLSNCLKISNCLKNTHV